MARVFSVPGKSGCKGPSLPLTDLNIVKLLLNESILTLASSVGWVLSLAWRGCPFISPGRAHAWVAAFKREPINVLLSINVSLSL